MECSSASARILQPPHPESGEVFIMGSGAELAPALRRTCTASDFTSLAVREPLIAELAELPADLRHTRHRVLFTAVRSTLQLVRTPRNAAAAADDSSYRIFDDDEIEAGSARVRSPE